MASCNGTDEQAEKNRKNAFILKSHIFKHDIVRIIHFCFELYKPGLHNEQFIIDAIHFNHEFLAGLEEYSKGKVLTIRTGQKRMVKRKKKLPRKKGLTDELSERDDDFDPEQPDKLGGEGHDEEMEGE